MKQQIQAFLKKQYPGVDFDVSYPPEGFGDYSANIAFTLAKYRNINISAVAEEVVEKLKTQFPREFEKIEIAKNGFINFYLSEEYIQNSLAEILKSPNIGRKKTVIIEYSQPNIAKVMHVGHLRSTILGDALANIYESLGYKVIRWNYIGDWGTQFGKLIAAYKMWGDPGRPGSEVAVAPAAPGLGTDQRPATGNIGTGTPGADIDQALSRRDDRTDLKAGNIGLGTLNNLYVRFHEELKNRPELDEKGREEFKKLEEGDKENRKLWEWFKEESLKEFEKIYEILGVKFDNFTGESFFQNDLKPLVKELKDKGAAQESEGAIIINLDEFGLPPALIQKSDGASLYLTRDIAALKHRIKEHKPEKILYVVGNEQLLHFQQLFAVAKIIGLADLELSHVKFGLVLGENKKKLSTRDGRVVAMKDLIDKSTELAGKTLEEKNPELSDEEKDDISKAVGIGALKYFILKEHRSSDIVFDWGRILDLKGDSGPYLQYTYARLAGIRRKASSKLLTFKHLNLKILNKDVELPLMKKLLLFPEAMIAAAENNLINILTLYLYELCNLANKFYESAPVMQEEDEKIRDASLALVDLAGRVLEKGLGLLGIKALGRI